MSHEPWADEIPVKSSEARYHECIAVKLRARPGCEIYKSTRGFTSFSQLSNTA